MDAPRGKAPAWILGSLLILFTVLTVGAFFFLNWHLPVASEHGRGVDGMILYLILAAGAIFLLFKTTVPLGAFGRFLLFDIGGVCAIVALAVTFIVSAVRNTITLYREETIR